MRLTIVGCSGSFAGPASPASCYLLRAPWQGREFSLVLDLGNGSLGALQRHLELGELDAVALSHLHPDHCLDVTGLYVTRKYDPSGAQSEKLPVYGPAGTAERMAAAYEGIGPEGMTNEFDFRTIEDRVSFEAGPFRVTPLLVWHPVEAYGFRVECGDRVIAYSGDTDACAALAPLFQGADLVLADSAFVDGRDETAGIHMSGSRAAQAAVDAGGVRRLMLTHIPAWNDPEVCRAQAAAVWPGEVELAQPDATYQV
ncbi:MBL fold metallo-hydrolase [Kribbia dieselivorans]|uniref:MBL fold metallo-hydrolase n=1 Tax=Kribbia dieselivorans TaxID=331526 RepID=UPI000838D396|nr:MBL fold metallo-hydrolase [Kribbia dieselivorans]